MSLVSTGALNVSLYSRLWTLSSFQVETSLSSKECSTSVKMMICLRWESCLTYLPTFEYMLLKYELKIFSNAWNYFQISWTYFARTLRYLHRLFLAMKLLTQWLVTLQNNSRGPLSYRWVIEWVSDVFHVLTWFKSPSSWSCFFHLLSFGLLFPMMVWLSWQTGSFKRLHLSFYSNQPYKLLQHEFN